MLFNGLEEKVKELEETREQLIDSEKQYRSLNDNIPVGVFRTTPEGKILSSNPALFQMIAIREEDGFDTLNANQFYADSKDRISFLIELECNKNSATVGREGLISTDNSAIKVFVIPTNEEAAIANDTYELSL